jgi:hypothetical protein
MRRIIAVAGDVFRELLLPLLHRLADWADPAGSATQAWGPDAPDYVPDALLVRW